MSFLVDTSVWSLALRRDGPTQVSEVSQLQTALTNSITVVTTGLILQELLQGFNGPRASSAIIERFQALQMVNPDRHDHIAAAEIRNTCRKSGVQIGTIDAILIQLCCRHRLTMLSADRDFEHAAQHIPFSLWRT